MIKPVPFIHPPPIARPRPCVILLSKTKVGCSPIQHNGLFPLSTSLRTTALLLKITLVRCVLVRLEVARNAQRHFPDFDMCPVQIRPVVRNAGDESRPSSALSSTACIIMLLWCFFSRLFFIFCSSRAHNRPRTHPASKGLLQRARLSVCHRAELSYRVISRVPSLPRAQPRTS